MKCLNIELKTWKIVKRMSELKVFMHALPFIFYFEATRKNYAKKNCSRSLNLLSWIPRKCNQQTKIAFCVKEKT